MNLKYLRNGKEHILYDADTPDQVDGAFFEPEVWQRRNDLIGTAQGRGAAMFVRGDGGEYVLRHYRRGGAPAKISHDCYFWFGLGRTRAWREWHLLVTLHRRALPAPRPVAVRVVRGGLCYRADIVTARIPGCSLGQLLRHEEVSPETWRAVGLCIRRFHDAGVYHADLNANNILVGESGEVFLVDFDRGRFRPSGGWQQGNLERLQRSLRKLSNLDVRFTYSECDWEHLLVGYR
ncbi:3-deoxy-D-manno-octulosonic acid kinase [Thiohalomonas denitrificans]|uniref:3-deoxy-D-manno-octulosonic acid kinase n=1 Tax=Thiohalomonas denitrificans TaxID=415747 RepID=UPI0026F2E715|nr:3-deoxy-D-manno-octulosonic acid kinase [Thiohalomonas denitrificans]